MTDVSTKERPAKAAAADKPVKKKKKRLSGFWLFVIIYAAAIAALNAAAVFSKPFCDFYADHIFRVAAETTGRLSGIFPFSLGEVLITVGILLVAAAVILSILLIFLKKKKRYVRFTCRFLKTSLVIALTVVLLYTCNCSILYCSTMLNFAGGVREFSVDDVEAVRNYVVEQCNELAPKMQRSSDGILVFSGSPDKAAQDALHGVSEQFPRLRGYYPPAKEMLGSYFMYRSNIIGVYFPFSMEANYSRFVSDSYMPHVVAHEYAHLKGYIYEDEANFMSFIACVNSSDEAVRYSGYLCVLYYIDNDYSSAVSRERLAQQPQLSDLVKFDDTCYDPLARQELAELDERHHIFVAEVAENVGSTLTDAYMDAYDYEPNYSEVTLLMMQYYTEHGSFACGG